MGKTSPATASSTRQNQVSNSFWWWDEKQLWRWWNTPSFYVRKKKAHRHVLNKHPDFLQWRSPRPWTLLWPPGPQIPSHQSQSEQLWPMANHIWIMEVVLCGNLLISDGHRKEQSWIKSGKEDDLFQRCKLYKHLQETGRCAAISIRPRDDLLTVLYTHMLLCTPDQGRRCWRAYQLSDFPIFSTLSLYVVIQILVILGVIFAAGVCTHRGEQNVGKCIHPRSPRWDSSPTCSIECRRLWLTYCVGWKILHRDHILQHKYAARYVEYWWSSWAFGFKTCNKTSNINMFLPFHIE